MKKNTIISIVIVALILVGGGGFYFGMNYSKSQVTASLASARTGFPGTRGARTGATGGGFITGSIIAEDATSITLQLPNNAGSKIIFYSSATQIAKTTSGTSADFTTGTNVSVTGTTNTDGSVTAQSIQIRPVGFARPTATPAAGQ